jgi:asparagine synthase (glutamine-hydrolysing)
MCGIYGRLQLDGSGIAPLHADRLAISALRHRGPDDEGIWYGSQVCLGMRRLSVIDLSTGHQPIFNEDRSVCVVYNGEIYNFQELRQELAAAGHQFTTESDTEVIVHGWEQWGEDVASRMNGMFAFALWDESRRLLWIVRDRLGIKPLYCRLEPGRRLLFASEIKSILAHPDVPRDVDEKGLFNFLAYGHAVGPDSIYRGIRKLMPGHALRLERGELREYAWWNVVPGPAVHRTDEEWRADVRTLLEDGVRRQMVADVPVGAFLSGGLDSSAVVALMQRNTTHRVRTFSLGFDYGGAYNELADARRVAAFLGTDHHELIVKPEALVESLQALIYHYDEPFGDAACFPTYLVSKLARQHVTVALTGEGGDELFGGYPRYKAERWLHRLSPLLSASGSIVTPVVGALPRLRRVKKFLDAGRITDDIRRYSTLLRVFTDDVLQEVVEPGLAEAAARYDGVAVYRRHMNDAAAAEHMNRLMYVDLKTWLADTYLEKVDKASMAVSLEARVPLLDHRLVELSFQMPSRLKLSSRFTKRIFKQAVADLLPKDTLAKRKHGFSVPTDPWFRGELSRFAYDVLLDSRTRQRGFFRADAVERLWREHQEGRQVRDSHLWLLLNFELWARRFLDSRDALAA